MAIAFVHKGKTTFPTKQAVLDHFEIVRFDWLQKARDKAVGLALADILLCTDIFAVREACPIPDGVNPTVAGAVFNTKDWVIMGYRSSPRKVSHERPIGIWKYVGAS